MLKALPRSSGSVNAVVTIASAAGASTAPNAPWIARAVTSIPKLWDAPPSAEAKANPMRPICSVVLRPMRSLRRPPRNRRLPKASEYAVISHWRSTTEKPSDFCAEGIAMFTIVASRTTMSWASPRNPRITHRLVWCWCSVTAASIGSCLSCGPVTLPTAPRGPADLSAQSDVQVLRDRGHDGARQQRAAGRREVDPVRGRADQGELAPDAQVGRVGAVGGEHRVRVEVDGVVDPRLLLLEVADDLELEVAPLVLDDRDGDPQHLAAVLLRDREERRDVALILRAPRLGVELEGRGHHARRVVGTHHADDQLGVVLR